MTARPGRRSAPSVADRRFAARARQARLRRLAHIGLALLAAAAVGVAGWVVGWSDALAVDEVRVTGVGEPLSTTVLDAAEVPVGTPLIRLDTAGIAARVAEVSEVADVEVSRSWPSAVTVQVTPRTPVATVPDDDQWWRVDASGVLFGASAERPGQLPVLQAGDSADDAAARAAGVAVIADLPAEVADLVEEVRAHSGADVRLILADDIVVRWGTADDTARKAEVLLAMMAAQEETAQVFDVSAPEAPAVDQ